MKTASGRKTPVTIEDIRSVLRAGCPSPEPVTAEYHGELWYAAETSSGFGMCMYVPGADCRFIAEMNAFYNRGTEHFQPFEEHYTAGMDFAGKTVGVVGHLGEIRRRYGDIARQLYVFELDPKDPSDLPAELEDELLPHCDIAIITGSSLVNGTLPHLLELCENAYTVLTGPSVPQCPALLDFGIDRLAGLCVTDRDGMRERILGSTPGTPYSLGKPFLIVK